MKITASGAMSAQTNSKRIYAIRMLVWILAVAGVVCVQIFVPKTNSITAFGTVTWSWNAMFRGLFLVSPTVGFICSGASQLNNLAKIWANPLYLFTPALNAFFGLLFWRLCKKSGKNKVWKDIILILAFAFVHSTMHMSVEWVGMNIFGLSESAMRLMGVAPTGNITFALIGMRTLATFVCYFAVYPIVLLVRKYYGGKDPFMMSIKNSVDKKEDRKIKCQ